MFLSAANPVARFSLPPTWYAKPIAVSHFVLNTRHHNSRHASPNFTGSASPFGLTPTQIRGAYGIGNISFGGITGNGAGQTIAIIDAYNDPTITTDLHNFDAYYGLPDPPSFQVLNQSGGTTLPGTDPAGPFSSKGASTWEQEISLDVEWAHVIAPNANIILYEASNTGSGLYSAASTARNTPGVTIVSMSWGGSEFLNEANYDSAYFTTPSGHIGAGSVAGGITFLASTGDNGAGNEYPAISSNVVAVGGTTLTVSGSNYVSESGWSGSGGGVSSYETQPAYQTGIVTQSTTRRTAPDISIDANPSSGVPIYDSYDFGASTPWIAGYEGGTSLACPLWAGLVAIADQGRALAGLGSLDGQTQTLPALYKLPASDLHDITSGSNGFAAGAGYDLVTGRGTPIANTLVPDLAGSPVVTSLSVSPNTVPAGNTITLTATGVSDPNSGGTVSSVAFYRETNGTAGLQTGADTLLGTATSGSNGSWSITSSTTGFAVGSVTYYAVATDSVGLTSSPAMGTGSVQLGTPSIGGFSASPNPIASGATITLNAAPVTDPNAGGSITGVNFYRESNGSAGLQFGSSGDTFVGAAVNNNGTWTLAASSTSLGLGTYTYYAVATDNNSQSSAATSVTVTIAPPLPAGVTGSFGAAYNYNASTKSLSLTSGTLTFGQDVGSPASLTLNVTADGASSHLLFSATQHLNSLTMTNGAMAMLALSGADTVTNGALVSYGSTLAQANTLVLVINSISIPVAGALLTGSGTNTAQGTLDLANNAMILNYTGTSQTAINNTNALMAVASDYGAWDGTGITSSVAQADAKTNGYTSVGVAENSTTLGFNTFAGQTLAANKQQMLFMFTYNGDASLDGKVSSPDVQQYLSGLSTNPGGPAGTGWGYGEFDYGSRPGSSTDVQLYLAGSHGYGQLGAINISET